MVSIARAHQLHMRTRGYHRVETVCRTLGVQPEAKEVGSLPTSTKN
jgi:hypothetical protein